MKSLDDVARLRTEYEDRKQRFSGRDTYSWSNPAHLFTVQGRQRAVLGALKRPGFSVLDNIRILEMGCGGAGAGRDGSILSYDFWLNPTNRQTRGLRPKEIRESFPGCRCTFERITLAPPVTRRLVSFPWGWGLCLFLESLKLFNTHYLAAIRPGTVDG